MSFIMSQEFIRRAILNPLQDEKCVNLHEGSCNAKAISQFVNGCKSVYKMYLLVHLIPFLLFKRKKFMADKTQELKKLVIGFVKSLLFAGGYSMAIRRIVCWITEFYAYSQYAPVFSGLLGSIALCLEPYGRQSQIALFCLNKSMDITYGILQRRGWALRWPGGECWLLGISMGIITFCYFIDASAFRQNYQTLMSKLIKDC